MEQTTMQLEIQTWQEQTAALRQKLAAEHAELEERLEVVEAALASLPPEPGSQTQPTKAAPSIQRAPARSRFRPNGHSLPELVVHVLAEHPDGLPSKKLIEAVHELRPSAAPATIHSAVHRLKKTSGRLRADGELGERRYVLTG
jgi:hypothetical protein